MDEFPHIIHEIPEVVNESGSRTPQAVDRSNLRDSRERIDSDNPDQLGGILGRFNRPESNQNLRMEANSEGSMSMPAHSLGSRLNSNISPQAAAQENGQSEDSAIRELPQIFEEEFSTNPLSNNQHMMQEDAGGEAAEFQGHHRPTRVQRIISQM